MAGVLEGLIRMRLVAIHEVSVIMYLHYLVVYAVVNRSQTVDWRVMEEFALPGDCVVIGRKTGFGWHTVFQQAAHSTPNTIDDNRGLACGANRVALAICCLDVLAD